MANAVQDEAARTPGKEARAMESFAHALRQLPTIIAENGGYDSAQLVSELRAAHKEGHTTKGLGNETDNETCFYVVFFVHNLMVSKVVGCTRPKFRHRFFSTGW